MLKIHSEITPYNKSKIKQIEGTTDYKVKQKDKQFEIEIKKYEISKSKNIDDIDFIKATKSEHILLISYLIKRYMELSNDTLDNVIKNIKDNI